MSDFLVHYCGVCFESGNSYEQVAGKVHDKMAPLGKVMDVVATAMRPNGRNLRKENYVVSFEGGIALQAETDVDAENQAYKQLSHLGQIRAAAFRE